jgi:RNA polymerase sigma-70 factor, ECF subfamily
MTDNEIISQILKGDKEKFRLLVEQYQQMIFRTCMGFLHNKDDADDLTQEVFIQAYLSLRLFKADAAFSTWIYRIAVNASLNKIRKSSKNFILHRIDLVFNGERSEASPVQIPDTNDPEKLLIHDEDSEWVRNALDSLPENQRTALVLSKYDDLSQKKIAEIMNTTEGAVEALLHRAKKSLREKLTLNKKNNRKLP